jgi:geranylgeranyl diphosphate synthase type II
VQLGRYQRAKTGALFVASTCAGAQAAGADPQPWRALGEALGEAYQVADDIRDVMGADQLGKPVGQDVAHGRPSTAAELGLLGAVDYFRRLMQSAVDSVPACPSRSAMQQLVLYESERLLPQSACDQIAKRAGQVAQQRATV